MESNEQRQVWTDIFNTKHHMELLLGFSYCQPLVEEIISDQVASVLFGGSYKALK